MTNANEINIQDLVADIRDNNVWLSEVTQRISSIKQDLEDAEQELNEANDERKVLQDKFDEFTDTLFDYETESPTAVMDIEARPLPTSAYEYNRWFGT